MFPIGFFEFKIFFQGAIRIRTAETGEVATKAAAGAVVVVAMADEIIATDHHYLQTIVGRRRSRVPPLDGMTVETIAAEEEEAVAVEGEEMYI